MILYYVDKRLKEKFILINFLLYIQFSCVTQFPGGWFRSNDYLKDVLFLKIG